MREARGAYADIIRKAVVGRQIEEAEFVGRDIRERGLAPADCVVLGRTNRLVQLAAEGLQRAGLEAFVPQRKTEFDSPVPSVLVEALRLNFPGIVDWFLEGGWRSWGDRGPADDGLADPSESETEEVETWRALHREIVGEYGRGVTLNVYLQRLDLSSKTPPPVPNAVQCISVHRAKGLEFQHVYLIGMAQEVFPSYRALQRGPESKEVEEERRSCFVAITRARETLTLTRSREYFGYRKGASQFLGEMGVG